MMEALGRAVAAAAPASFALAFGECHEAVALFLFFRRASACRLDVRDRLVVTHSVGDVTWGKASVAARVSGTRGDRETAVYVVGSHLECGDERYDVMNAQFGRAAAAPLEAAACVVMMGDLDYRIELERARVLADRDYGTLLRHDQLARARRKNPGLAVFREGVIAFAPTHKFDAGVDVYDTSAKQRMVVVHGPRPRRGPRRRRRVRAVRRPAERPPPVFAAALGR